MYKNNKPLAERIRPKNLDDFSGQKHLVGEGKVIRRVLESGFCPSMVLWGPPGVGKTTLASIIANDLALPFYTLSAINAGVKQIREVIALANRDGKALLFIDEIHRFSKSQQDSLLGAVENGTITLIGATTENPSFEVIAALLSRCQVYVLEVLTDVELKELIERALVQDSYLASLQIELKEVDGLIRLSGGDGRRLLNLFELLIQSQIQEGSRALIVTDQLVDTFAKDLMLRYDKSGEQHYDIVSAFIKSIRGSDPNAAVYWLARMIEGGEDPKFIARRLLISASEDIGNANPTALVLANTCFEAVNKIGYPECDLILSQTTVYLATSSKSNASYKAIKEAKALVHKTGNLPVPLHLRNAPTKLMKKMNYGKGYQYAHSFAGNFVNEEFMPDKLKSLKLYDPGNNARENDFRKRLKMLWKDKYGY